MGGSRRKVARAAAYAGARQSDRCQRYNGTALPLEMPKLALVVGQFDRRILTGLNGRFSG